MPGQGRAMPIHYVRCPCGADLALKTYWKNPKCRPCRKRQQDQHERSELLRRREEARRYRIVLHVLGWEDDQFEEMLAHMKASPMMFRRKPETRAARYDLKLERRASA